MRSVFLTVLVIFFFVSTANAEVFEYEASGHLVAEFNSGNETAAAGLLQSGETFTVRFAIDTDEVLANYSDVLPQYEQAFYFYTYPINLSFEGGFSIDTTPIPSASSWDAYHWRFNVYEPPIPGEPTSRTHLINQSSQGATFSLSESVPVDTISIDIQFTELFEPYELASVELNALPVISSFEEAIFALYFSDRDDNGYWEGGTSFVGYMDSLELIAAPAMACIGFHEPMADYPVAAKKNRVFPLKMELMDEDGYEISDADLTAPPVVHVEFVAAEINAEPTDVSGDAYPAGEGTEGNQFVYTDEGVWQFNLKSKNYTAAGEYAITVISGDDSEYIIEPLCMSSFIIQ